MNPNEETPVAIGEAWNEPIDPTSLDPALGLSQRDAIAPGTNSPNLTGMGWRREIRKMYSVRWR